MKPKHLILWALLLAVAIAVYFYQQKLDATQKAEKLEKSRLVTMSDPLQVQSVRLAGVNYPKPVLIERRDAQHEWAMIEPVKTKADAMAVGQLIGGILDARVKQTVKDPKDLKQFGLEPPWVAATLKNRKGDKVEVHFGSNSPTTKLMYARLPGQKAVHLVPLAIRTQVGRTLKSLRNRQVLDFVVNKVKKLTVEFGGETITVSKTKDQLKPEWRFPDGAKADTDQVEDALYYLSSLQTTDFIDQGVDDKAMGFDKPRVKVTLAVVEEVKPAGKDQKPTEKEKTIGFLIGGKVAGRAENYVRRLAGGPGMSVVAMAFAKLPQSKKSLLYRDLWDVDRDDVTSLKIERQGKLQEFAKSGEAWRRLPDGQPKSGEPARMFLWDLVGLKWEKVLPANGDYGLDKPELVITFAVRAKKKDAPAVARKLTVGKTLPDGKLLAAKVDGDDRVFALSADILNGLPKEAKEKPAKQPGDRPAP